MSRHARISPRRRKLTVWLICTVLAAVVPLLFLWVDLLTGDEAHGLSNVLASGELILISGVLAFGSLGELYGDKAKNGKERDRDLEFGLVISAVLLIFSVGWLYPLVRDGGTAAVWWSLGALAISVLHGGCTIGTNPSYRESVSR
ncbi:hypothetical protein [Mycobacterium sp. SMC-14]|uniref:hypothetical protein n=1 Tax=Mycobacterium sp. SMC-14 TaxID=3385968 RepID=UPI00390CAE24